MSTNVELIRAERERILSVIAETEAMADRWERGGGPRQVEYAAKARTHVRLWRIRLAELAEAEQADAEYEAAL